MDFVRGFGFKSSPKDEDFGGYHRQVHSQEQEHVRFGNEIAIPSFWIKIDTSFLDLCYNVRYPAQVNKGSEYPWVFRQLAIYQSYTPSTSSSQWILLQPSVSIEESLARMLDHSRHDALERELLINVMILESTEAHWRAYINYMESEINALVRTP